MSFVTLGLEATHSTEHRRLIEQFTLRSQHGEAVLQVIRAADGKRVEAGGQASLFSRDPAKSRAFMEDLGCPCERPAADLRAFSFPIVQLDSGTAEDGTSWRGLKFQISHGGQLCEGTLTVRDTSAELSVRQGEDVFWSVARIALGEGLVPRDPRPATVSVTTPQLVRGVEDLRIVPGHRVLLGIDAKGALFSWGPLDKKPRRLVNLDLTVTAINAVPGRAAACGAHPASGAWRVVSVDLEQGRVEKIVDSGDDFPFLNARLMVSADGARIAVAWENELRVFEGARQVSRVVHSDRVIPRSWLGDGLFVETPDGDRRWSDGAAELQFPGAPLVHRHGEYELEVRGDGGLTVRHPSLGERVFRAQFHADRRCIRLLAFRRPRWLGEHHLLLWSDRLVALDLRSFQLWVAVEGPDTELRALLDGETLVVEERAGGRPRWVDVRGA